MNKLHFFFFFALSVHTFSQTTNRALDKPRTFSGFSSIVSETYNIGCKKPVGFKDTQNLVFMNFSDSEFGEHWYCPILESEDQECLLMYRSPSFIVDSTLQERVKTEIKSSLGLGCCSCQNRIEIKIEDYATMLSQQEARTKFNADYVYLMKMPLTSAYKDKYTHCVNLMIFKSDGLCISPLFFFTETGYNKKDEYLEKLSENIWYNHQDDFIYDKDKYTHQIIDFIGDVYNELKEYYNARGWAVSAKEKETRSQKLNIDTIIKERFDSLNNKPITDTIYIIPFKKSL